MIIISRFLVNYISLTIFCSKILPFFLQRYVRVALHGTWCTVAAYQHAHVYTQDAAGFVAEIVVFLLFYYFSGLQIHWYRQNYTIITIMYFPSAHNGLKHTFYSIMCSAKRLAHYVIQSVLSSIMGRWGVHYCRNKS